MKKINKYVKVVLLIIVLMMVSFHIYMVYFYEDTRWNASVNLSPEELKIYRENLNK